MTCTKVAIKTERETGSATTNTRVVAFISESGKREDQKEREKFTSTVRATRTEGITIKIRNMDGGLKTGLIPGTKETTFTENDKVKGSTTF